MNAVWVFQETAGPRLGKAESGNAFECGVFGCDDRFWVAWSNVRLTGRYTSRTN